MKYKTISPSFFLGLLFIATIAGCDNEHGHDNGHSHAPDNQQIEKTISTNHETID